MLVLYNSRPFTLTVESLKQRSPVLFTAITCTRSELPGCTVDITELFKDVPGIDDVLEYCETGLFPRSPDLNHLDFFGCIKKIDTIDSLFEIPSTTASLKFIQTLLFTAFKRDGEIKKRGKLCLLDSIAPHGQQFDQFQTELMSSFGIYITRNSSVQNWTSPVFNYDRVPHDDKIVASIETTVSMDMVVPVHTVHTGSGLDIDVIMMDISENDAEFPFTISAQAQHGYYTYKIGHSSERLPPKWSARLCSDKDGDSVSIGLGEWDDTLTMDLESIDWSSKDEYADDEDEDEDADEDEDGPTVGLWLIISRHKMYNRQFAFHARMGKPLNTGDVIEISWILPM
jgi:hypothetical protein